MSTATRNRQERPRRPTPVNQSALQVSLFENVASMILALLILVGATVVVLFTIWLTNRIFSAPESVPVVLEDVGGGRPDGIVGESMELDAPDGEMVSQETDLALPQMAETLAQVSSVIAARVSDLADPSLQEQTASASGGRMQGDGRRPGYGFGDGPPGVPRYKRWEIYYAEGGTADEYAKQLDFFQIELGVVGGDDVEYVSQLNTPTPTRRTGDGESEKRLYMSWRQGNLKKIDQQLLRKAGVAPEGKLIVQFYPPDIENRLAQLELGFANRKPEQIRRTRFGVRAGGSGYEFYVIDQTPL